MVACERFKFKALVGNWYWLFGLLVSFSVLLCKKLYISTFTLETDFLSFAAMPSQWTKCKKARDFYNCMKSNSSKIQNWHSALSLAAQVGKMKRFLCSDWPPSGQDGRILSTCSLLMLLLLLLLFVWTPTLSRSMKYPTGVISYPDLRWYGEKRERIWRHLRMKTTSQSVRQCWPLAKIYFIKSE